MLKVIKNLLSSLRDVNFPKTAGNDTKPIGYDHATGTFIPVDGGGAPGGGDTQVQRNSSGVFSGDSGFTYDGSGTATLSTALVTPVVKPASDSTTAIVVKDASGINDLLQFDTTNRKLSQRLNNNHLDFRYESDEWVIESSHTVSGAGKPLKLQSRFGDPSSSSSYIRIDRLAMPRFKFFTNPTTATGDYTEFDFNSTASFGSAIFFSLKPSVSQLGTAGYTAFEIDVTETALGSGEKILFSIAKNGTNKVVIDSDGNMALSTSSPTALLDVNSDIIRLRTSKTPASASDTGNAGDHAWDSDYIYVCTATNTWKRAALATW